MATTLVLDKSAVVAAPPDYLKGLRRDFSFLLPDVLGEEIGLEAIESDTPSSPGRKARADASLRKCTQEAGNEWVERMEAVRWEAVNACSAHLMPRSPIQETSLQDADVPDAVRAESLQLKKNMADWASITHDAEDEIPFKAIRRMSEKELYEAIQNDSSSDKVHRVVVQAAQCRLVEEAIRCNQIPPSRPEPDRGWLTYGLELVSRGLRHWKYGLYGDDRPRKPDNLVCDLYYVGFMAIADGILSHDAQLLKLAWAIWPEKRRHIYDFRPDEKQLLRFEPPW